MRHPQTEIMVTGKYALFTDPITKVGGDRHSYPVPTYEALKGIMDSIYKKPTFSWVIDEARIMKKIQMHDRTLTYHMNHLSHGNPYAETCLFDVAYQIRAHMEWNEGPAYERFRDDRNIGKHLDQARRHAMRGGHYIPFLGRKEFPAEADICRFGEGESYYDDVPLLDLGVMYHGITYANQQPEGREHLQTTRLWNVKMENGIIRFAHPDECTMTRDIIAPPEYVLFPDAE